jgi:SAM-dependent methyltransferase
MPDASPDGYEYRGLIAQSWDLLRGDTSNWPDRPFYRDRILESGQPVLDVGCGTGRLLLDYLAEGMDIDGVDNSPEMLALCRDKAAARGLEPTLYEQAMESLDLPRRYRTILVPSSSFLLIIDARAAREAMRRFHAHLEPGGALVMPFMLSRDGPPGRLEEARQWHKVAERERPSDGALVRHWTRETFDYEQQLWHSEERYEVLVGGDVVQTEQHRRSPAGRWYTQEQSLDLYREAGFGELRLLHEFTTKVASANDRIWSIVGRRSVDR